MSLEIVAHRPTDKNDAHDRLGERLRMIIEVVMRGLRGESWRDVLRYAYREITTLPGSGTRRLSGVAVTAGQFVSAEDIASIVAKWTRIPVQRLTEKESEKLVHMEDELHRRVVHRFEVEARRQYTRQAAQSRNPLAMRARLPSAISVCAR